jgi:hypothetical protein
MEHDVAAVTQSTSDNDPPASPPIQIVSSKQWQSSVEPLIAQWVQAAGPRLRRHRATLGPWVLEYVGTTDATFQLFRQHWIAASTAAAPDAYCYHFTGVDRVPLSSFDAKSPIPSDAAAHAVVCFESGRALVLNAERYGAVNRLCDELITNIASRPIKSAKTASRQAPREPCWVAGGTGLEYETEMGESRCVVLFHGDATERSAQGYALAVCKPSNSLIADGIACVRLESGTLIRTKSRLWWPARLVANFRNLLPHILTSPIDGLALDDSVATSLQRYRNAPDLERAFDGGGFSEEQVERLYQVLSSHAHGACALVDPVALLGIDRWCDRAQLTHLMRCVRDPASPWVVQPQAPADFPRSSVEPDTGMPAASESASPVQSLLLTQLLEKFPVYLAVLNQRLPVAQTQFCLRHYLEGLSDSIRLVGADSGLDPSIVGAMHLERGSAEAPGESSAGAVEAWMHGPRRVNLVMMQRAGACVELVAFDHRADGYAQVRSVWPGQVADFFSRHVALRVRELFTEVTSSCR